MQLRQLTVKATWKMTAKRASVFWSVSPTSWISLTAQQVTHKKRNCWNTQNIWRKLICLWVSIIQNLLIFKANISVWRLHRSMYRWDWAQWRFLRLRLSMLQVLLGFNQKSTRAWECSIFILRCTWLQSSVWRRWNYSWGSQSGSWGTENCWFGLILSYNFWWLNKLAKKN